MCMCKPAGEKVTQRTMAINSISGLVSYYSSDNNDIY